MSILLILVGVSFTASVICAITIFACAATGGKNVAPDLGEEPLRSDMHSGPHARVESIAPNQV
jgi:hypothetical protein